MRGINLLKILFSNREMLLTILGVLLGWGISHIYYLKSLDDLKRDAEERKRVEWLVLRGIESIGHIKYSRDSNGDVIGVVIELKASSSANASASAVLR